MAINHLADIGDENYVNEPNNIFDPIQSYGVETICHGINQWPWSLSPEVLQ